VHLTVSLYASKARAIAAKSVSLWKRYAGNPIPETLPVPPCFNVVNGGGEHAGNAFAFQKFFIILLPTDVDSFTESRMVIGFEIFHNWKAVILAKFGGDATMIGDEGLFASLCDVDSGLAMLIRATEKAGYLPR
jgi:enolase